MQYFASSINETAYYFTTHMEEVPHDSTVAKKMSLNELSTRRGLLIKYLLVEEMED